MAKARVASATKTSIKTLVYGEFGSRKSGTVVDFAMMKREDDKPMRVLYIDCETGSIEGFHIDRLEENGVDLRNVYIVYTTVYDEVAEYIKKVIDKKEFYELDEDGNETDDLLLDSDGQPFYPDAVVIDGITVLADNIKEAMIEVSEIRAGIRAELKNKNSKEKMVDIAVAGMEFKDWDKHKSKGKSVIRKLITSSDVHVGITARSKPEKEMKRDNQGNMVAVTTGKDKLEQWDFIAFEVNTVLHNKVDDDGNCFGIVENKDRTGMFKQGEVIENPSVALWQPIIEKNKSRLKSVATTLDSYDDSIEKEVNNQIKVETAPKSKQDADGLKLIIQSALAELKPADKKIMAKKVTDKGYSTKFSEIEDIQQLKGILKIIQGE